MIKRNNLYICNLFHFVSFMISEIFLLVCRDLFHFKIRENKCKISVSNAPDYIIKIIRNNACVCYN